METNRPADPGGMDLTSVRGVGVRKQASRDRPRNVAHFSPDDPRSLNPICGADLLVTATKVCCSSSIYIRYKMIKRKQTAELNILII